MRPLESSAPAPARTASNLDETAALRLTEINPLLDTILVARSFRHHQVVGLTPLQRGIAVALSQLPVRGS